MTVRELEEILQDYSGDTEILVNDQEILEVYYDGNLQIDSAK